MGRLVAFLGATVTGIPDYGGASPAGIMKMTKLMRMEHA